MMKYHIIFVYYYDIDGKKKKKNYGRKWKKNFLSESVAYDLLRWL